MPLSKPKPADMGSAAPARAIPYHLDTVVKQPLVSTDTVIVTMGGKEYHTTRDLLATGKTPNFFTALARGNFAELHPCPPPLLGLQAMESEPPPGQIYRVNLPEADRKSYRYIKHWQRTCTERRPGVLPRNIPQTELDVLALDASMLCMQELEKEVTSYYELREKARLEPNTKNIYKMARATFHEMDDDELIDTLYGAIVFNKDFEVFEKLIESPGLKRQDPRFLICALPSIVDSNLYRRIVEQVTALGSCPELLHAVRTDVPFLVSKIKSVKAIRDAEHLKFFVDEFLSIDEGMTLEALLEVDNTAHLSWLDRGLKFLQKLCALRGSDDDWMRLAKAANSEGNPGECLRALRRIAPDNSLRTDLIACIQTRVGRFDTGYFGGLGVVCLALRPTFEEIAGASHTDMTILDRILVDWSNAEVEHPSTENDAVASRTFRQACETHRLTLSQSSS